MILMTASEITKRLEDGESPLELSIEKYYRIIKYIKEHNTLEDIIINQSTCALCHIYNTCMKNVSHANRCKRCPIYRRTGTTGCINTPFEDIEAALDDNTDINYFLDCVQEEIEFLESLRE